MTVVNGEKNFVDFAYVVAGMGVDGARSLTFRVEMEVKLPRSARDFSRQIGSAQGRFGIADSS